MQVLLTIVLIAAAAAWLLTVQQRLERLRREVREAWKVLEADQDNAAVVAVYNNRVAAYNAALDAFPASLVAALTGFKPARRFGSNP